GFSGARHRLPRYRRCLRRSAFTSSGHAGRHPRRRARGRPGGALTCARASLAARYLGMMDLLQKILAFAVTLGVLITFHELGHYVIARLAGVKVLRFSIGFGRVVWSRRIGPDGTEWAISAVPLGGYVKMVDEREGEVAPVDR